MKKSRTISFVLLVIAGAMLTVGYTLQVEVEEGTSVVSKQRSAESVSPSFNSLARVDQEDYRIDNSALTAVEMEVTPVAEEVIVPVRVEVYKGMTMEELADKLDRNLKGYIAGKGYKVASECIEKGVDPYVATAIMLHETGCNAKCSNLVVYCNNVGGQKGKPGCNGGSYREFDTLDEGIDGFVNNLSKNYYKKGLDTVEKIAPKYCTGNTWAGKINWYINKIENS